MSIRAGVVAVQGDVREHAEAIRRAGRANETTVELVEIREAGLVDSCDVLFLPGGESTTISRLVHSEGIASEIRAHVDAGKPMLATCAGLILASTDAGDDRVDPLGLLDITVERNAFGRQRDSFETLLPVDSFDEPFPAVFIRAPAIEQVGPSVDVLATIDGKPVAVREGPVVGLSFHPELTTDSRMHDLALFDTAAVGTM